MKRWMVVAVALLASSGAKAEFPSKPVTIVVPFGAGSGTDVVTRVIAEPLGIVLKQSVIVENKPGANGAIAAVQVARAAPDGHTLFMATNSPFSAAPMLNKTLGYDPVNDFAPISRVGSYTFILAVHRDLNINSIPELIAYAKANPGKLSYASGNTSGIVAGATLKQRAGIDIVHVPYKTVPQALNDVLADRIPIIVSDLTPTLPHVRAGTLRALGVTRLQRSVLLPDVPTFHEAGVTEFEMDSWAGVVAPAGTPSAVIRQLNTELRKIIDNPETKARLASVGFEAFSSTPEEMAAFVKVQLAKWTQMIKDAGIEAE
jgi:tripartite-type tricarboxylate transporter receptor subunit TctC